MKLRKLSTAALVLASLLISSPAPAQRRAQPEINKLDELKNMRRVYVTAADRRLLKNVTDLVRKSGLFQLVDSEGEAEFILEGVRGTSASGFQNEASSVYTTIYAIYAKPDGKRAVAWKRTNTSYAQPGDFGSGLQIASPNHEVYLVNRFVKDFKAELNK